MAQKHKHSPRTRRSPAPPWITGAPVDHGPGRSVAGRDDDLDSDDLDSDLDDGDLDDGDDSPDERVQFSFDPSRDDHPARSRDDAESRDLERASRWRDAAFYVFFLGLTLAFALIEIAVLAKGMSGSGFGD